MGLPEIDGYVFIYAVCRLPNIGHRKSTGKISRKSDFFAVSENLSGIYLVTDIHMKQVHILYIPSASHPVFHDIVLLSFFVLAVLVFAGLIIPLKNYKVNR